jgi:hypothetical protein
MMVGPSGFTSLAKWLFAMVPPPPPMFWMTIFGLPADILADGAPLTARGIGAPPGPGNKRMVLPS